uniref:Uncharacterized protein n=1 Tax=Chromera velia CCMP2878 TaxID=1169474 RepID=A0A0G4FGE9_9ALVE|eukprot:Cvel_3309.t1-p1 / transcript=Cvel_3309.t1 / gene=Cvel_3309 / organism=Chromera_velia_CCMP2878 / gene_product=hypothetical protein / transcript_product=hypothetical protein / location=Cvel_scaffold131:56526-67322(+) / protein_length=1046 / sequence_SO=supercontig / SO=protein_coding / is_pseudo=false
MGFSYAGCDTWSATCYSKEATFGPESDDEEEGGDNEENVSPSSPSTPSSPSSSFPSSPTSPSSSGSASDFSLPPKMYVDSKGMIRYKTRSLKTRVILAMGSRASWVMSKIGDLGTLLTLPFSTRVRKMKYLTDKEMIQTILQNLKDLTQDPFVTDVLLDKRIPGLAKDDPTLQDPFPASPPQCKGHKVWRGAKAMAGRLTGALTYGWRKLKLSRLINLAKIRGAQLALQKSMSCSRAMSESGERLTMSESARRSAQTILEAVMWVDKRNRQQEQQGGVHSLPLSQNFLSALQDSLRDGKSPTEVASLFHAKMQHLGMIEEGEGVVKNKRFAFVGSEQEVKLTKCQVPDWQYSVAYRLGLMKFSNFFRSEKPAFPGMFGETLGLMMGQVVHAASAYVSRQFVDTSELTMGQAVMESLTRERNSPILKKVQKILREKDMQKRDEMWEFMVRDHQDELLPLFQKVAQAIPGLQDLPTEAFLPHVKELAKRGLQKLKDPESLSREVYEIAGAAADMIDPDVTASIDLETPTEGTNTQAGGGGEGDDDELPDETPVPDLSSASASSWLEEAQQQRQQKQSLTEREALKESALLCDFDVKKAWLALSTFVLFSLNALNQTAIYALLASGVYFALPELFVVQQIFDMITQPISMGLVAISVATAGENGATSFEMELWAEEHFVDRARFGNALKKNVRRAESGYTPGIRLHGKREGQPWREDRLVSPEEFFFCPKGVPLLCFDAPSSSSSRKGRGSSLAAVRQLEEGKTKNAALHLFDDVVDEGKRIFKCVDDVCDARGFPGDFKCGCYPSVSQSKSEAPDVELEMRPDGSLKVMAGNRYSSSKFIKPPLVFFVDQRTGFGEYEDTSDVDLWRGCKESGIDWPCRHNCNLRTDGNCDPPECSELISETPLLPPIEAPTGHNQELTQEDQEEVLRKDGAYLHWFKNKIECESAHPGEKTCIACQRTNPLTDLVELRNVPMTPERRTHCGRGVMTDKGQGGEAEERYAWNYVSGKTDLKGLRMVACQRNNYGEFVSREELFGSGDGKRRTQTAAEG